MKKMLSIALVVGSVMLSACTPSTEDRSHTFAMPEGLKDCTVHRLTSSNLTSIYVTRCSNSVSTTLPGKHATHSSTVEQ